MRQIRDMSIMEIDITNVCEKRCSNCTRFCGHHEQTYFMDFETFKRAVDSLDGYEGLISTIGGEPLLHPEYNRFAEYLRSVRNEQYIEMNDGRCKAIVKDYLAFAKAQRWFEGSINKGKGYLLFTSMPQTYYQCYESVEDTVTDLWLNDHTNPSFHQPILVSRKDLGISDEEFAIMRDNCWLENFWSASITPKGVFFCEVAGTLDMLFHGPGGKQIEPGWWKRDIMDFQDQFHWCDICGMALSTYSRNANDEIDDASPTLMKKLALINSPKLKNNKVHPFNMQHVDTQDGNSIGLDMGSVTANYLPDNDKRVGNAADNLRPKRIYSGIVIASMEELQQLQSIIHKNIHSVTGFFVITLSELAEKCQQILVNQGCDFKIIQVDGIPLTIGGQLNLYINKLEKQDWILLNQGNVIQPDFVNRVSQFFLNPGYLFVVETEHSKALMISKMASTLKKSGFDRLQRCISIEDIIQLWDKKVCVLDEHFEEYPDMNIPYFREIIQKNYEQDIAFKYRIKEHLIKQGVEDGNILLLQSAFVYHTLGIYQILTKLGYHVYILSSIKFKDYFDGYAPEQNTYYFSDGAFEYALQKDIRKKVKDEVKLAGCVVPFSFGPSTVKHIDDYTDALRTAEDVGGSILGIINIRRNFIEPEYDIWDDNAK